MEQLSPLLYRWRKGHNRELEQLTHSYSGKGSIRAGMLFFQLHFICPRTRYRNTLYTPQLTPFQRNKPNETQDPGFFFCVPPSPAGILVLGISTKISLYEDHLTQTGRKRQRTQPQNTLAMRTFPLPWNIWVFFSMLLWRNHQQAM